LQPIRFSRSIGARDQDARRCKNSSRQQSRCRRPMQWTEPAGKLLVVREFDDMRIKALATSNPAEIAGYLQ
jgi:hypothetical protein